MLKNITSQKIVVFALVMAVFVINFSLGFPRLSRYSSVDEPYWTYDRTPDFWRAISEHKWKHTDINDKPGITVAEISGIGLGWTDPLAYKSLRQEPKSPEVIKQIMRINFILRLPIYLTTLVFLGFFFFFSKKLFDTTTALLSLIFIGLSPILLGMSLIINPDSLLWGFLPLSILSYLIFQKDRWRNKKYLTFSGIFLGLALLTKYVANILFVYFLGLLFLEYIFNDSLRERFPRYFFKSFLAYLTLIAVSLATFYALFPACWKKSKILLDGTILSPAFKSTWPIFVGFLAFILFDWIILKSRAISFILNFLAKYKKYTRMFFGTLMLLGIFFVLINVYGGMKFFDFEKEMASPKGGSDYSPLKFIFIMTTDIYGLVFALTPSVFLLFLWSLFANTFGREARSREASIVLYFVIFILIYYAASTANFVTATIRYQIALFPLASIIAAIGLRQIMKRTSFKRYLGKMGALLVPSAAIAFSLLSLILISPYFFVYASPFLPQKYILNLKDMGDGSFQAAQYLNKLPNAQNLIIWSDKGAVCETFLGKCKVGFSKKDTKNIPFDYFVASTGRKSRSLKLESAGYFDKNIEFRKLYSDDAGTHKIVLGGQENNFVKIYKTSDLLKK